MQQTSRPDDGVQGGRTQPGAAAGHTGSGGQAGQTQRGALCAGKHSDIPACPPGASGRARPVPSPGVSGTPVSPAPSGAPGPNSGPSGPSGPAELLESLFYYRDALRSAQRLCVVTGLLALLGLGTAGAVLVCRPEPVYFGMSQDMKLLPLTPLNMPIMNETALRNWAAEAVTGALNIDYLNWREQLSDSRMLFTREAFTRFAVSLDEEGHLPLLRQQRALMHAVLQGTPIITKSGVVQGALSWEIEVPVLISYETSRGRISSSSVTVVCQVRRMPVTDFPRGVALTSLVTLRRQGGANG